MNNMNNEIMIDIETLSTQNNAMILTIGAIKFQRNEDLTELKNMETFYVRIDTKSCKNLNMHVDDETLKWWGRQSEEAKNEVFYNTDRLDINESLTQLSQFLKGHKYIWSNSPSFDCVILENAFKCCGIEVPWKFWNLRDCRTVYDLGRVNLKSVSVVKHNALDDCYNQIIALKKSLKNL